MLIVNEQTVRRSVRKLTRLYSESDLTLPFTFDGLVALLTIYWIPTHINPALNSLKVYLKPLFHATLFFFGSGL